VYSNLDYTGRRHAGYIFHEKSDQPTTPFVMPQSIIDSARDTQLLLDARQYRGPTFTISQYDPSWPFTAAQRLPPVEPRRREQIYYGGNFVPLTPNGPLVNPDVFRSPNPVRKKK